jgi:murein DD-endopeptidase MepM/ murein hydrolase activator NlpD
MWRSVLPVGLLVCLALGLAPPAAAQEVDLVGTWYVLMHYLDDGSPNPDQPRWDERVWVFEKKGNRMRWSVYPIVVFDDESGRFERTSVQYSRVLHYWEPDAGQLADIAEGLQVHPRGAKKKTLRGSDLDGWSSSRSRGAASASVVTYTELYAIEGMPTRPEFTRSDIMGGGRTDTLEGLTSWTTTEVREGGDLLTGAYQRDGRRHGTFRMMRSGATGGVKGSKSQAELQQAVFRRTLEQSLKADPAARAEVEGLIEDALAETGIALTEAEMAELEILSIGLYVDEVPPEAIERRVGAAIQGMLWRGATPGARHDESARYRWPFDAATPRKLIHGVWAGSVGQASARPAFLKYAFDFGVPVGTPVVAARAGVVGRVVDGHTQGGAVRSLVWKSNTVTVAHADGTLAIYSHLEPGISVSVGQEVSAGEALGKSGKTGYVEEPELFFAVLRLAEDEPRSVDVRFDDGSADGVSPVVGMYYGGTRAQ